MASFSQFGNDLFTGRRQINFIGRRRMWYLVSAVLIVVAALGIFGRGLNFSLEFKGGSQIQVSKISDISNYDTRALDAVKSVAGSSENVEVTKLGNDSIQVEAKKFGSGSSQETDKVAQALTTAFKVPAADVNSNFIGPSWGSSVTNQAVKALIVFLILVVLLLWAYFRTWKMSVAALVALAHDLFITVGIYALTGIEVSPATVIGFLTILGYSIYDTVVVFDKVRENTTDALRTGQRSYAQAANYAVNQTLVRSINTSVVALLPIASLLVVGILYLGPGTLLDLAVALFFGIAVGTYSSIFIATPTLVSLRNREPVMGELAARAKAFQTSQSHVLSASGTSRLHGAGEEISGVLEPEVVKAAAKARSENTGKKREIHPAARRDRDS